MSAADALFMYISGLKEAVQIQVMLHDPADLLQTISLQQVALTVSYSLLATMKARGSQDVIFSLSVYHNTTEVGQAFPGLELEAD